MLEKEGRLEADFKLYQCRICRKYFDKLLRRDVWSDKPYMCKGCSDAKRVKGMKRLAAFRMGPRVSEDWLERSRLSTMRIMKKYGVNKGVS